MVLEIARRKFFPASLSLFLVLLFLFFIRETGSSNLSRESLQAPAVQVQAIPSTPEVNVNVVEELNVPTATELPPDEIPEKRWYENIFKTMVNNSKDEEYKWEKIVDRKTFMDRPVRNTILVDKANRTLYVAQRQKRNYKILYEFPVSVGLIQGNKVERGDMRTPEGIYKVIDVKFDKELPAKYGPMAFVLSYPTSRDRLLGKTGSGIWLHGTGQRILTPDTKGCVELTDKGIVDLSMFLAYNTPIFIFPERRPLKKNGDLISVSLVDGLEMEYVKELPMLKARLEGQGKG